MKSKYQHIFFDLDHTLWDHDRNSEESLLELFSSYKLEDYGIVSEKFIETYKKINRKVWKKYRQYKVKKEDVRFLRFANTIKKLGVAFEDEKSTAMSEDYLILMQAKNHLFPYTVELLEYLTPNYQLHIITNGFCEVQHRKLENANIKKYFQNVVVSEDAGKLKPHPIIFEYALEVSSATAEDSLMIGDNMESDIKGARSAGIDQVYFNPDKKKHLEVLTFEIQSLDELMNIL